MDTKIYIDEVNKASNRARNLPEMGKNNRIFHNEENMTIFVREALYPNFWVQLSGERVKKMKRKVIGYLLSAASVYLTMDFLTKMFMEILSNAAFSVI